MPPGRRHIERAAPPDAVHVVPRDDERRVPEQRAEPHPGTLTAATAGETGLRLISRLTAKETEAVTLVEPMGEGWVVHVEVVEDRRVPSSGDMLALYEAEMDGDGDLLSYRRVRRYRRGMIDDGEGVPR
ncbi:gas vesicle protein GvpO [Microtetraspora glauca]|uniref:Gas vesicle protein GvpO n=1 Tax=Microtetraspora glauca TaxID=1996 RepID=A0ABV3GNB1_MICGL